VIKMGKNCIKSWPCLIVFLASLLVLLLFSPSPVFIVIGTVVLGLVFPRKEDEK